MDLLCISSCVYWLLMYFSSWVFTQIFGLSFLFGCLVLHILDTSHISARYTLNISIHCFVLSFSFYWLSFINYFSSLITVPHCALFLPVPLTTSCPPTPQQSIPPPFSSEKFRPWYITARHGVRLGTSSAIRIGWGNPLREKGPKTQ